MKFSQAVKTCFKKKYFTISGRASRSEFWWFQVFIWGSIILAGTVLVLLIGATGGSEVLYMLVLIATSIFYIILIPPSITATVRRFHDIDISGWWVLGFSILNVIPYLGVISALVMLYFLIKKGTSGDNRFGSDSVWNTSRQKSEPSPEPATAEKPKVALLQPTTTTYSGPDGPSVQKTSAQASQALGKTTSASVKPELDLHEKARKVIEYSDDAKLTWKQMQGLPEAFQSQFLAALDEDPMTDPRAIADRLMAENQVIEDRLVAESQKALRPFEDPEMNNVLDRCRQISDEAASEFMQVNELLGDKIKPQELLAKIEAKFLSPERVAQKKQEDWQAEKKAQRDADRQARVDAYHRKLLRER